MKINRLSTPDLVYRELEKNILNKKFKVGEQLPSENELAKIFDVNRLTIRLALQRLNIIGLTETLPGKGTYIKKFDMNAYLEQVSSIIAVDNMEDVLEFRELIELSSANLAIDLATSEEIQEAREIINIYNKLAFQLAESYQKKIDPEKTNPEKLNKVINLDYDFHRKIVAMSHNKIYQYAYSIIKNPILEYLHMVIVKRMSRPIGFTFLKEDLHSASLDAIEQKDPDTLKKVYTRLIDHKIMH